MTDSFFKKRQMARRAIMLNVLEKITKEKKESISTVELYHHVFKKGYSYAIKTLEVDLRILELKGIIEKEVVYQGRGYGTKSLWKIKEK